MIGLHTPVHSHGPVSGAPLVVRAVLLWLAVLAGCCSRSVHARSCSLGPGARLVGRLILENNQRRRFFVRYVKSLVFMPQSTICICAISFMTSARHLPTTTTSSW